MKDTAMNRRLVLWVLTLGAAFTFLSCSGSGSGDDEIVLTYDAVVGEFIELDKFLFPDQAALVEEAIGDKWEEIDALYEMLETMTLPAGYTPYTIWEAVDDIAGLDPAIEAICNQIALKIDELSTLQDYVNYAAGYLWESNNATVADVNGNGFTLVTDEGTATITGTAPGGTKYKIIINATQFVEKVNQLQMQNEAFLALDNGNLQSFNTDGSVKAQASVTLVSYDEVSGDVVLSGTGSVLVSVGQLLIIAPCTEAEEGAIRTIDVITPGTGVVTFTTSDGDLAAVLQELDMTRKEAVDSVAAESGPGDTSGDDGTDPPGMKQLTPAEFQSAVAASEKGQALLKELTDDPDMPLTNEQFILKKSLDGSWSPSFSFSFDKTDSQDNESDGSGYMTVNGVIGFSMPIEMYFRYSDWKLQRFYTHFKPTQYADIQITVDGDADIYRTLGEVKGPRLTFAIGPLPVYVRPIFEIGVGGSAVGNNVTVQVVDYEVWSKYGVDYRRGRDGKDWRPVTGYNRVYGDPSGMVDGDYELSAYGKVQTTLKFYGLGGPYASAVIGGKFYSDTSLTAPGDDWQYLRSYLKVNTGIEFDVTVEVGPFDYTIVDYNKNFGRILNKWRTEWDSNGPYEP